MSAFAAEHVRQRVEIVTNAAVAALEGMVQRVVCADGRVFAADLAVIGIGAAPNDELARDAGLWTMASWWTPAAPAIRRSTPPAT